MIQSGGSSWIGAAAAQETANLPAKGTLIKQSFLLQVEPAT